MSNTKECYYINTEGPVTDSVRKAFIWLSKYESAYIAVHQNGNLDGIISEVIGEQPVKDLKKTGNTTINNTLITLVTERKPIRISDPRPLVAFHVDAKYLDTLQSVPNLPAMLVVPWILNEVKPWIRTVNAKDLDAPNNTPPAELIDNKVVVQALKTLSALVNKSTGILHPLDKGKAIQTFTILRNAGEKFNPEDVKAFLVREEGWKATYAQEVADLAQKILDHKQVQGATNSLRPDILEMWRKEANEKK